MHKKPIDCTIGLRLAELRDLRGLSLRALAARIGVRSRGTIHAYEHGLCRISLERLLQLAKALNYEVSDLLAPIGSPPLVTPPKARKVNRC